jgi:HlyD family secretion protein
MGFLKSRKFWVLVGILVVSYFSWRWWIGRNGEEFQTAMVEKGELEQTLILSGEIEARKLARMAFQTAGNIARVEVKEGDWVEKGDLLARLDTYKLQQELTRAQFDLRQGDAIVYRVYDEVKGHDSDETFEQAEDRTIAEVARDKAYYAVKSIEKDLVNASLWSPIEGLIVQVANADPGVNILPSENQFVIVDPESIYFEVFADQTDVTKLFVSQPVTVILDSFENKEIIGVVEKLGYIPEQRETGTVYAVEVSFLDLNNNGMEYRLGMTGDAEFVTDKKSDVLYVPVGYVQVNGEGEYLLVNERKDKLFIEMGLETEEFVEVSGEGVREGLVIYDML